MFRQVWFAACICVLAASVARPVQADPAGCEDAANGYNSAASDVGAAVQDYSNCVDGSQGHDDCSSEFGSLQSAQDDFETAVSNYESECN